MVSNALNSMYGTVQRALRSAPDVMAELYRRGMFMPDERQQLSDVLPRNAQQMDRVLFLGGLAGCDLALVTVAISRRVLSADEMRLLDRLLSAQPAGRVRDRARAAIRRALDGD